jgi:hypothetical protein
MKLSQHIPSLEGGFSSRTREDVAKSMKKVRASVRNVYMSSIVVQQSLETLERSLHLLSTINHENVIYRPSE